MPLSVDPTDAAIYSPSPTDLFTETIDTKTLFPEVALPVENNESPLTPPVPALELSFLIVALSEIVSVLKLDAIFIEPSKPDLPEPPKILDATPSALPETDIKTRFPPVSEFD